MKQIASSKLSHLFYIICLVLMPFVLMFYQYQRNFEYLAFMHILAFSGVIALVLIAMYFISKLIVKSRISAFLFAAYFFFGYFMLWSPFESAIRWLQSLLLETDFTAVGFLLFVCLCGLLIVAICITICVYKYKKSELFASKLKRFFLENKRAIIVTSIIIALLLITLIIMLSNENFGSNHYMRILYMGMFICSYSLVHMLLLQKLKNSKEKFVAPVIIVMLCVMLVMNSIQIIVFAAAQETDDTFHMSSWNVTEPLEQQPNIYWLHVDAMLGFDAMLRFFGDDQEELTQALESRGFWISRGASFDGRASSSWAIPTLMNPYFYDRVISWELDPAYAESLTINEDLLTNPNLRLTPNFTSLRTARERNETVLAFNAAGFNTSTIASLGTFFFPTVDQFYCAVQRDMPLLTTMRSVTEILEFVDNIANLQNAFDLMSEISFFFPSSMNEGIIHTRRMFRNMIENGFTRASVEHNVDLFENFDLSEEALIHLSRMNFNANALMDIFERPEPRFVTIVTSLHHTNWVFDEVGNFNPDNAVNNPSRYAAHHTFSANVTLMLVDLILDHDPNAVIVWQADHGLHGLQREGTFGVARTMEYFNCTEEEAVALWHSTASAIRLPNIVGGGYFAT